MLFDIVPKSSPKTLFGRDEELANLIRLINARRWVTVLGPRMVGKTSLIRAANEKLGGPTVYVNLWGARGIHGLLDALVQSLNASKGLTQKIVDATARIDGLSIGPGGLSVTVAKRPLNTFWNLLDMLGRQNKSLVIELDEVQELSAVSGPLLKLLANIFNSHPGIVFVFSGSMFGLIRTLLHPSSSKSPMYGRPPAELYLHRFTAQRAQAFLEAGYREYGVSPTGDPYGKEVESKIDGIPGWLTLYGNYVAVERLSPKEALRKTIEQGRRVASEELEHFLEGRDRMLYLAALLAAANPATWSEVKEGIEARRGTSVADSTVNNVLTNLAGGMLLEHEGGRYQVVDPILKNLLLRST